MKRIIFLCLLFLILVSGTPSYSQRFAPVGTAVAQFLEVGMGARAAGLGEAYTTMTTDAGSAFWNPAGLVAVKGRNLFTSYVKWPADISFAGLALAYDLGSLGTVALSTIYLMTDDMEVTTVYQPNGTGENFGINNYSLGLSYARSLTDRFSVGLTGKWVHEKYWSYGYDSWAFDLGTLYRTEYHGLKLGMSIQHFGPEVRFDGSYIDYSDSRSRDVNKPKAFETYSLPINFRFGVSIDLLDSPAHKITTAADMVHPNNNYEQYNWGVEYGFNQILFLRGGYKLTADEGGLALGMGLRFDLVGKTDLALDYAYSDYGVLKSIHRVSFALEF